MVTEDAKRMAVKEEAYDPGYEAAYGGAYVEPGAEPGAEPGPGPGAGAEAEAGQSNGHCTFSSNAEIGKCNVSEIIHSDVAGCCQSLHQM